eukprot:g5461.t1
MTQRKEHALRIKLAAPRRAPRCDPIKWRLFAPLLVLARPAQSENKQNFALCLGNFRECHDYVQTLLGPFANAEEICTDRNLREECEKNSDEDAFRVEQWPISQRELDYGVGVLLAGSGSGSEEGREASKFFGNKLLVPYLNYCDYLVESSSQTSSVKQTVERLLSDRRICSWGHENDHVSLSLDQHVFGLSHFAAGLQQVVDGGLPEKTVKAQAHVVTDLCEQFVEISLALLHGFGGEAETGNDEMVMDPVEYAFDVEKAVGGYEKLSDAEYPNLEDVGDSLLNVHQRWLGVGQQILGYKGPNELDNFERVCSGGGGGAVGLGKNNGGGLRNRYHVAFALQLTVAARLLMLHARTSLGLKLVFREVFASQEGQFPWNMPPQYVFAPIAYGRHWDVLDALLLGETATSPQTLLIDRDARQQLRSRPLRVLEIGVAVGQNGNYLLSRYPNLHYTGVDPTIAPEVRQRFAERFPPTRFSLLAETSQDVVEMFGDGSFDLVFIDGPHTYKQVNHDILHYAQKVKKNGILAGHDFTCVHPPLLWGVSDQRLWQQKIYYAMDGVWWWPVAVEEEGGAVEVGGDLQEGGGMKKQEL